MALVQSQMQTYLSGVEQQPAGNESASIGIIYLNQNNKMSTSDYYRLALLQWIRYNHSLADVLALQEEIAELEAKVSAHQKKHRRCDRDIEKHEQCPMCEKKYGSEVALKLHIKLKHCSNPDQAELQKEAEIPVKNGENKENLRDN